MNFLSHLGHGMANLASNASVADSVRRLMQNYGNVVNPVAILSLRIQKRRIGPQVGAFDFEDIEIQLGPNMNLNKAAYFGFEAIIVKSIHVMPYTDVVITNQNRFNKQTVIHNGTGYNQIVRWDDFNPFNIKPRAFVIETRQAVADGVFKKNDSSRWFDARMWTLVGLTAVVIIVIIVIISALVSSKEGYTPLINRRPANMPEDLHSFSEIRKNTRLPKPYDWEKHVWT